MAGGGCDFFFRKVRVAKRVRVKKTLHMFQVIAFIDVVVLLILSGHGFLMASFYFYFFQHVKNNVIFNQNLKHKA